jgi:hypothetical protein
MLDIIPHLDSVGQADDVQAELRAIDSVVDVELLFPSQFYLYRHWFDERTEKMISPGPGRSGTRPPGHGATAPNGRSVGAVPRGSGQVHDPSHLPGNCP